MSCLYFSAQFEASACQTDPQAVKTTFQGVSLHPQSPLFILLDSLHGVCPLRYAEAVMKSVSLDTALGEYVLYVLYKMCMLCLML